MKKNIESQPWQCPHVSKCPFFTENQSVLPDLCEKLKKEYCLKDNKHCARLRLRNALDANAVPALMMPHQHEWVDQILLDAGIMPGMFRDKLCL